MRTSEIGTITPWYLLQIKPSGLSRAQINLQRQNVCTFMPLLQLPIRRNSGKISPLFPGYLFAAFNPTEISFRTVNSTLGVSRLVTNGYNLESGLPIALIEGLKDRCDIDGILRPPEALRPGESIRILAGPFANYVATVKTLSAAERVQVLFELMGQVIQAEISVADVERAELS